MHWLQFLPLYLPFFVSSDVVRPADSTTECEATDGGSTCLVDQSVRTNDPHGHGPLDCHGNGCEVTGIRCHAECECRHLDNIERLRFQSSSFRYPEKPILVMCTSRDNAGTASTWLFNAVRLLFRQAREACDSYWIRSLTREKFARRMATGTHVVVKTHEWTPHVSKINFEAMQPLFTHVIYSRRQGRKDDSTWMSVATHIVDYEDVVAHAPHGEVRALLVLQRLAAHLGLDHLHYDDFRAIDYELMTLPVPRGSCNQTTKFWPHHNRRGGRAVASAQSGS